MFIDARKKPRTIHFPTRSQGRLQLTQVSRSVSEDKEIQRQILESVLSGLQHIVAHRRRAPSDG